jgi:predicted DNA-binding transcriptional regulator AlpA
MQSHNPPKRRMVDTADAAAYCGSSASTFAKLRLNRGGPVYVKLGKRVVYDPADLDRWLAAHRRASISERAVIEAGAGRRDECNQCTSSPRA